MIDLSSCSCDILKSFDAAGRASLLRFSAAGNQASKRCGTTAKIKVARLGWDMSLGIAIKIGAKGSVENELGRCLLCCLVRRKERVTDFTDKSSHIFHDIFYFSRSLHALFLRLQFD